MDKIFVFGSNLSGFHFSGSAAYAVKHCGAVIGMGEGLQGNSYALPTVGLNIKKMPFSEVEEHIVKFIKFASENLDKEFKVTQVGCLRAGFTADQIAPLFRDAPDNCFFDTAWKEYLGEEKKYWGTY